MATCLIFHTCLTPTPNVSHAPTQTLYERDPEFRTNCQLLLPGLLLGAGGSGPRPVGAYLARHLKDLGLGEVQESWVK